MNSRIHTLLAAWLIATVGARTATGQCTYATTSGTQEQHAGWGTGVAISGSGEVALVGGPGADGSDGIVRSFVRTGSAWEERDSLWPADQYDYAAEFGWCVALSYDGNTAAVGAPGDVHGDFGKRHLGAVYVFARDPASGDWTQQARLTKPDSGSNEGFGQAIALSDAGDRLLVGQRNHIGSEWARVADSAWVFSRQEGGWSDGVELVGTDLGAADEFGAAVALSPDGLCAVVSALGEGQADGRVFVFRHDGAGWPLEQVLGYPEATGWDSFGNAVATDGASIMVGDELYDDPEWGSESVGAVHLFAFDGAEWVRQPGLIRSAAAWPWYQFGHALALRGDCLLVGCPNADGALPGEGAVHIVKRLDGKWTLTGTIHSNDPQEHSRFGAAVAMATDRADYLIGDPWATVEGMEGEGRVHFANAVSAPYDFAVVPGDALITITISFLGYPVEIVISPYGEVVGIITDDCEGAGAFLMTGMDLETGEEPIVFAMPPQLPEPLGGAEVVVSDVRITLAEAGDAAALDNAGYGMLVGNRLEITGWMSIGGAEPAGWSYTSEPGYSTVLITGEQGGPFEVHFADFGVTDLPIDAGLGDANPTVTLRGNLSARSTGRLGIAACGTRDEGFCLQVTGSVGADIVVEATSDLVSDEWTPVYSGVLSESPMEVVDTEMAGHPVRFYRARGQ